MPHLRFRYDTPINASPSRHLNRPKPWVFWQGSMPVDHSTTTNTLPCFHLPESRGGTNRAVTLPDGYYGSYGNGTVDNMDTTISTHFSDHSLNTHYTLPSSQGKGGFRSGDLRTQLRTSLPDMNVDRQHLERHLKRDDFEELFDMTPIEFYKLPEWKRIQLKRKHHLF
uniref:HP domain-containing protein n=1 Tax=Ditylenchus dipsaci TaxID=166011 RepID=A0A915DIW5_9BILA